MNANQLQPFCSTDPFRLFLLKPFSINNFTYATNGAVLVRVPRLTEVEPLAEPLNIEKLCEQITPVPPHAVPIPAAKEPSLIPCYKCSGKKIRLVCAVCNGEGSMPCECINCGDEHTAECSSCKGGRLVGEQMNKIKEEKCEPCGATGTEELVQDLLFGAALFQNKYIKLLNTLPNCVAVPPADPKSPLVFWFDGGDGLLMPRRK
jgi:hypothetical protein